MKKIFLLSITLLIQVLNAEAQQNTYQWRVGAYGGFMYSVNDISPTPSIGKSDFMYGLSAERFFNKAWSAKLLVTKGQFTVNDRYSEKNIYFGRSLNAQTQLLDFGVLATYSFDNERNMTEIAPVAPYISAGLGLSTFKVSGDLYYNDENGNKKQYYYWDDNTIHSDTKANNPNAPVVKQDGVFETELSGLQTESKESYPTTIINIPIALGIKFRLNDQINLNLEGMARFTNTDYLEDASNAFRTDLSPTSDPNLLLASKPNKYFTGLRGDKNTLDVYGSLMLSLHYNFGVKVDNDILNVPIVFNPQIPATHDSQPSFKKEGNEGASIAEGLSGNTSTKGKVADFAVTKPLLAPFKTKDTTNAAISEIERMRLEVAYINRELTQIDTTQDNSQLIHTRFARMTEIRTKVNDYRKFALGSAEDQEKVKTAVGELQNERKEALVSVNILMLATSDKSKIVDNLKKKEADNDLFIKRQEKRVNELRQANNMSVVDMAAVAAAEKTVKVEAKPIKVETPPIAKVETPKTEVKPAKVETPKTEVKPAKIDTPPVAIVETLKTEVKPNGAGQQPVVKPEKSVPAVATTEKTVEQRLKEKEAEFEQKMKEQQAAMEQRFAQKEKELQMELERKRLEQEAIFAEKMRKQQEDFDRKMKEREAELKQQYGTDMVAAKEKEEKRLLQEKLKALEAAAAASQPEVASATPTTPTPAAKVEVAKKAEIKKELDATKKALAVKEAESAKKAATPNTPNNQIWFIPNDSQLTPTQQARLKSVITFLKGHPEMTIELKPFIEPGMKDPDLPYTRADVVKNFLIYQGGVDINRIQVALAGTGAIQVGKRWVSGRRIDIRFLVQ